MKAVLDNEEELQHVDRLQRTERMKLEKQIQEERRERIKRVLPMAISFIGVFVLMLVGIAAVIKSSAEKPVEETQTMEQEAIVQIDNGAKKTAVSELLSIGMDSEVGQGKEVVLSYSFASDQDTVRIDCEEVNSPNAILVNEHTDMVVASRGERERINPASMTKVLTILVAMEHISKEKLEDTFVMTKEITDYAYVNDCSCVGFLDGEKVTVRDLFYGTILSSGGDAAVGLATYVAGSHEAFVKMMNEKLAELGLEESSHFTNCVGLYDEEHYSTVYDMAVIMKAAVNNEFCKEFLSTKKYTTMPTVEHPEGISISNWFLRRIEDKDAGGEVLCAKTGYVAQSKNCAVSYGTLANDTPYICVTVGAYNNWRCIYDHVEIYNRYVK